VVLVFEHWVNLVLFCFPSHSITGVMVFAVPAFLSLLLSCKAYGASFSAVLMYMPF
jgi:hypothetical protein